jgi:hypothetical protein
MIEEAATLERSSMPSGMWLPQKDMGAPRIRVSTPSGRSRAFAASPYGPAPMMATWQL